MNERFESQTKAADCKLKVSEYISVDYELLNNC